jgi:hypothetical protein
LRVVVADVPPERHEGEDKRGNAQHKYGKQYAHGNPAQE